MAYRPSQFKSVYLIHDKGGSPDGVALRIQAILEEDHYDVRFDRPCLPYRDENIGVGPSLDWLLLEFRKTLLDNSLLIGFGLGGLLAARLQEYSPNLNLTVMGLLSPTREESVAVQEYNEQRLILNNSRFIRDNWKPYSRLAFDLPWLIPDINQNRLTLGYLISSYMDNSDIEKEITTLFPDQ